MVNQTDLISRMQKAYETQKSLQSHPESQIDRYCRLKMAIREQRQQIDATRERLAIAATNYAREIRTLRRKLEMLEDSHPAFVQTIEATKKATSHGSASVSPELWQEDGFLALESKETSEDQVFVLIWEIEDLG